MNSLLHRKNDFGRKLATVTLRGPHIPLQEVSCNVASSIVTGSPLQEVSCNVASSIVTGSLPSLPNALLRNEDFHRPGSRIDVSDAAKHYLQKQDYRNRTARLQSFRYWDGLLLSAELVEDLVDAGFYMISQPDVVRCCSCRVEISNWRRGDKAIDVHRRYNPSCDFVKSYYIQKLWYADNDGLVCDDNDTASRDVVGAVNQLDSERPAIKERIKKRVNNLRPRIAAGGFRDLPRAYHPLASISIHSQTVKDFDTWSSPSSTCPAENISFTEMSPHEEILEIRKDGETVTPLLMICKICFIDPVDHVLLPCGDAKTCRDCARNIFRSGRPCSFCGCTVATIYPIYT